MQKYFLKKVKIFENSMKKEDFPEKFPRNGVDGRERDW